MGVIRSLGAGLLDLVACVFLGVWALWAYVCGWVFHVVRGRDL